METESINNLILEIKSVLSSKPYILGIFLSCSTIENKDLIDIFILIEHDKYIEDTINLITSAKTSHPVNPDIWSLEAFQKADKEKVHTIFKEGRLIYWNAMVDILASQVFKVKTYTIFTFSFDGFTQKDKVRINYQVYGKNDDGLLSKWEGQRLARSCFYVSYSNKYKVTRYFNNNNVKYEQKDVYF